ncbi:MAG: hypothetical protein GY944_29530, partial [bacterium]|nr:hypothetical protein [bacterium]
DQAGIRAIVHRVKGQLSKYFSASASQPPSSVPEHELYMVDEGHAFPIATYAPLYRRYSGAIHLTRVYADPDRFADARRVLDGLRNN